ncbi:hypothetical protein MTX78_03685 [Hymenobacter tibetensis]|uniref:Trimeric autotransporter adhesin YadA-like head domain-containing protein n=1 Tax=Hymenobacter tibetensis TaxID=497967 RepID=A0ABY4D3I3_9BACT|nr:hypothetical protein [Hymenobacter tibetensis]UOG75701.1 hypothetical protein MTX78_03685 [Hymenobacter tibetensis]
MKHLVLVGGLLALLVGFIPPVQAQVGVGTTTPDASAALHISATNKGVLFPQVSLASLTDAAAVPSPAPSLLVYNTNAALSGGVGFYYNAGTTAAPAWTKLTTGATPTGAGWNLTGNPATDPARNFLGTTDSQPLVLRTQGIEQARLGVNGAWWLGYPVGTFPFVVSGNVLVGYQAGGALTPTAGTINTAARGVANIFLGVRAGATTTIGSGNTFIGNSAGEDNVSGTDNIFIGGGAGGNNTSGGTNIMIGSSAGRDNQTGSNNYFVGFFAGLKNTASNNFFVGFRTGLNNYTGTNNHFEGYEAGTDNTASNNQFVGYQAGTVNTTGTANTFEGNQTGFFNTTGSRNAYLGFKAGYRLAGSDNTALGNAAGSGATSPGGTELAIDQVTLIGSQAGQNNTADRLLAIGYQAGQSNTGDTNQFMGYQAGRSNTSGTNNYASGYGAGVNLTTGDNNALVGIRAATNVSNGSNNTTLGYNAGQTVANGSNNTLLGYQTDVSSSTLSYATALGSGAEASTSNTMALGGNTTTNRVRVGIGTGAPNTRLSITPGLTEAKITLYDANPTNHYGFGVSAFQLNYHVGATTDHHVFYAGGKNGDGAELLRITGTGEVNRPSTAAANLLPVAYGRVVNTTVNTFPAVLAGINTINGEVDMQFIGAPLANADLSNATIIVTCITAGRVAVARGTSSGHIIVNVTNPSSNAGAPGDFQFVVYRP